MKKLLLVISLGILAINFFNDTESVQASESESYEIVQLSSSYKKTVIRNWSTSKYVDNDTVPFGYNPIPRSITVSDIKNGQLYSGRLQLVRYYRAKGKYVATYSGTMYKSSSGYAPLNVPIEE